MATISTPTTTADNDLGARRSLIDELVAAEVAGGASEDAGTLTRRYLQDYTEYPDEQLRIWADYERTKAAFEAGHRRALTLIAPLAAVIDGDWRKVTILQANGTLAVRLNGPAWGDVELSTDVTDLLRKKLADWLPLADKGPSRTTVLNPEHAFVFRPNEVLMDFESLESGYVLAVEGEEVCFRRIGSDVEEVRSAATIVECLNAGHELGMNGQVMDLWYCPCRVLGSAWDHVVLRNGQELEAAVTACEGGTTIEEQMSRITEAVQMARGEG